MAHWRKHTTDPIQRAWDIARNEAFKQHLGFDDHYQEENRIFEQIIRELLFAPDWD